MHRSRSTGALLAVLALVLALTGCAGDALGVPGPSAGPERRPTAPGTSREARTPAPLPPAAQTTPPTPRLAPPSPAPRAEPPSIVLVLMDDFSTDLLPALRSARRMGREGASYTHAFTVDSLCCVSRTSLLTGQYPRQTGVRTNVSGQLPGVAYGGFPAFAAYGNADRSVNVALQEAGYTTGFVGKFLNEYEYRPGDGAPPAMPGWSSFVPVFGSGYDQWDFWSGRLDADRESLVVEHHPAPPAAASVAEKDAAYAGTFIESEALRFIRRHRGDAAPYFLEVAPYGTHSRVDAGGAYPGDPFFPPLFRDRPSARRPLGNCGAVRCGDLAVEDLPGYGDDSTDNVPLTADGEPAGAGRGTPTQTQADVLTRMRRDRARMAQSIDRTVQRILDEVGPDTYVVLTSDNGFHLGQNGLGVGKGTAYRTDVQVPLLVVGPGVVPGERHQLTTNIDLAPTFEDLAGLDPRRYRSGHSLVDTFARPESPSRNAVFLEHTGQASTRLDPDAALAGPELDRIPSYVAVRSHDALLVRLDLDPDPVTVREAWEFYSYRDAPWERTNTYADPRHRDQVRRLTRLLRQWDGCLAVTDERVTRDCRGLGAGTR